MGNTDVAVTDLRRVDRAGADDLTGCVARYGTAGSLTLASAPDFAASAGLRRLAVAVLQSRLRGILLRPSSAERRISPCTAASTSVGGALELG